MQVTAVADHITHAVIGGNKTIEFGVSSSAALMHMLSTALYSDQPLAVAREVLCNAWDSHIRAGKEHIALSVLITEDKLIIRDFGSGIAPDMMGPLYGTYGGTDKLKSNQAFTSTEEAQIQLGRALAGDHPEPIEEVKITEHNGEGIKVIPWITVPAAPLEVTTEPVHFIEGVLGAKTPASAPADTVVEAAPAPTPVKKKPVVKATKVIPDEVMEIKTAPKVDPKAVVKAVTKAKAEVESRKDKASRLYTAFNIANSKGKAPKEAQALLDFKKASKVAWTVLGLDAGTGAQLQFVLDENQDK